MEIILYLLAVAALIFLGRVAYIVYEVWSMDFDFKRPWPSELPKAERADHNEVLIFNLHQPPEADYPPIVERKIQL